MIEKSIKCPHCEHDLVAWDRFGNWLDDVTLTKDVRTKNKLKRE